MVAQDWPCWRTLAGERYAYNANLEYTERPALASWPNHFLWPVMISGHNREPVPDYLSWAVMGLVIEAMMARGWWLEVFSEHGPSARFASYQGPNSGVMWWGEATLPLAVARAAVEALRREG